MRVIDFFLGCPYFQCSFPPRETLPTETEESRVVWVWRLFWVCFFSSFFQVVVMFTKAGLVRRFYSSCWQPQVQQAIVFVDYKVASHFSLFATKLYPRFLLLLLLWWLSSRVVKGRSGKLDHGVNSSIVRTAQSTATVIPAQNKTSSTHYR